MSTNIQETLDRLRELDKNASPAPWKAEGAGEDRNTFIEHPMGDVLERDQHGSDHMWEVITWISEADADFIVETRNAIPELLAEIDRLTTENQELKRENHLAWSKGHAAGWDCHIVTMQSADLLPKDQKTSHQKGAHHDLS